MTGRSMKEELVAHTIVRTTARLRASWTRRVREFRLADVFVSSKSRRRRRESRHDSTRPRPSDAPASWFLDRTPVSARGESCSRRSNRPGWVPELTSFHGLMRQLLCSKLHNYYKVHLWNTSCSTFRTKRMLRNQTVKCQITVYYCDIKWLEVDTSAFRTHLLCI